MAKSVISKAHMKLIIDRIHDGKCVPFLGAAANISNKKYKYEGLPLAAGVVEVLLDEIEFKGRDPSDLARVALEYEFAMDRPRLVRYLKKVLPDGQRKPSPLLRTLAKLPFNLIVTTNYDRLLERAIQEAGSEFRILVQPAHGFEYSPATEKMFEELESYEGLLLYKIHGTFVGNGPVQGNLGGEQVSSVIITEDDYIEYLTVIGIDNSGVPKLIKKKITPSTLLFLGYSLEDWDFRTIYKGLVESLHKHQQRKSFAIQKDPSQFWIEFWQAKGVVIYNLDLYEFAEQLEESYQAEYGPLPNMG